MYVFAPETEIVKLFPEQIEPAFTKERTGTGETTTSTVFVPTQLPTLTDVKV